MSLLRLLSAGKSLVGLKDSTARYRMGHPGAMPKFGSRKNPFQTKTQLRKAPEAARTAAPAVENKAAQVTPIPIKEQNSAPVVAAPIAKTKSLSQVRNGFRFGSIFRAALRPLKFVIERRKAKSAGPPRSQLARTVVQAELSLDCVKVLRNDLSDADLEVVSAKTSASAPAKTRPIEQLAELRNTQPYDLENKTDRAANRLASAEKT